MFVQYFIRCPNVVDSFMVIKWWMCDYWYSRVATQMGPHEHMNQPFPLAVDRRMGLLTQKAEFHHELETVFKGLLSKQPFGPGHHTTKLPTS